MSLSLKNFMRAALCFPYFAQIALAIENTSSIQVIDATQIVVANQHSGSVSFIDLGSTSYSVSEISVGLAPQTLAFDEKRNRVWVANQAENTIAIISRETKIVEGKIRTADGPFGIVIDEALAYVSSQESDVVQIFDLNNFVEIASITVPPEPRGMALSADSNRLLVTHFSSGQLTLINTESLRVIETISLGSRATLTQSVAIDPDQLLAYIPNTIRNTDNPSPAFDTTVFPFVSIVDLKKLDHLRSSRIAIDVIDEPVGIPLESLLDGDILYVVNAASNDLTVIDINSRKSLKHLEVGSFPLGIASNHKFKEIYIDNSFDGTITVLNSESLEIKETIEATSIPIEPSILNGQKLFHSSDDPRMAKDQWISCATCHFDGSTDHANWFFPDGLRNTPSLIGATLTGPFHWSGNLDEIQDVEDTIRELQGGTGLVSGPTNCAPACDGAEKNLGRSIELDDLAAYVSSLKFTIHTSNSSSEDSESIARGKELFFDTGNNCSSCHVPPLYTDKLNHKLLQPNLSVKILNTPSLLRLKRSAPYLHDGKAKTLDQILLPQPLGYGHGELQLSSSSDIKDVVNFIQSLEPQPNLQVQPLDSVIRSPSPDYLSEARAMVEFFYEAQEESGRIVLKLGYRHGANVATDLYVVVEHMPTQEIWSLDQDLNLSEINRSLFSPTVSFEGPSSFQSINFPPTLSDESDLEAIYKIYVIAVMQGRSPFASEHWLSFDSQVLE